jgi:hypothetical protein
LEERNLVIALEHHQDCFVQEHYRDKYTRTKRRLNDARRLAENVQTDLATSRILLESKQQELDASREQLVAKDEELDMLRCNILYRYRDVERIVQNERLVIGRKSHAYAVYICLGGKWSFWPVTFTPAGVLFLLTAFASEDHGKFAPCSERKEFRNC